MALKREGERAARGCGPLLAYRLRAFPRRTFLLTAMSLLQGREYSEGIVRTLSRCR